MDVIGLDLSLTSTGVATPVGETAIKSKKKGEERLVEIREAVLYLVVPFGNPYIIIEGYSFGQQHSQAHSAGELGGQVRVALFERGIPFVVVPPTVLKKFITGKGNAAKVEVSSTISARTGIVFSTDDEADAYALRELGLAHFGENQIEWPKKNLEAVNSVEWV